MTETELSIKRAREMRVQVGGDPIPKTPIYLAVGVVIFSLLFVIGSRFTGVTSWELDKGDVVASRQVIWTLNDADQSITVRDAKTKQILETVTQKQGGFIHSAYRGIARERLTKRVAIDAPLTIFQSDNSRVWLEDKATDERIYLRAFGKDNEASIARYLTLGKHHAQGENQ